MILQEAFLENGYTDLLAGGNTAAEFGIDLEDIFDTKEKPGELLGIFISGQRDELFFLLDGDWQAEGERKPTGSLCGEWDDRIRIFTLINEKVDAVRTLKYNIVQLIVYSVAAPESSVESDLMVTRKIIIKGDLTDQDRIVIDDDEVIELPFHMIPADTFAPDETQTRQLRRLLPADEAPRALMKKRITRRNRRARDGTLAKSMTKQDYDTIEEWLKDDHS